MTTEEIVINGLLTLTTQIIVLIVGDGAFFNQFRIIYFNDQDIGARRCEIQLFRV